MRSRQDYGELPLEWSGLQRICSGAEWISQALLGERTGLVRVSLTVYGIGQ